MNNKNIIFKKYILIDEKKQVGLKTDFQRAVCGGIIAIMLKLNGSLRF
jgi:hypothetical protein